MKLPIRKGFRTLTFLYGNHGAFMRALVGGVSCLGVLLATGRLALASEAATRCWRHDDFELSLRRCSWYLRRSWLNINVSQDDLFDPTPQLNAEQLDAQETFLNARQHQVDPLMFAAEKALFAARRLDLNPTNTAALDHFETACNAVLSVPNTTSNAPSVVKATHKRKFPIQNAKAAFNDFMALFPPKQLPWFVMSGTFLGLIREKGFIQHDYDIDVGVFADQIESDAIEKTIGQSDRFVLKQFERQTSGFGAATAEGTPYLMKLVHVSGVRIDLFFHHLDTSKTPTICWHGSSLHRWENTEFALAPYQFYDWPVLGPKDADRYLTEKSGDWRTPVTEFNCSTDTPNLALVANPVTVAIFLRRFALQRHSDPASTQKLKATLIEQGFLHETTSGQFTFSGAVFKPHARTVPRQQPI